MRRDCEPDRGRLLECLAVAGLLLGGLSLPLIVPGLLGAPLGIVTWVLAGRDLEKMRAGLMDPRGQWPTRMARQLGFVAALLSAGGPLLCGLLIGALYLLGNVAP